MANLAAIIRGVIAGPVTSVIGPMRTSVTWEAVTTRGTFGSTYGAPAIVEAIVEKTSQVVATDTGDEKVSNSKFTFLEAIGIKVGDRLTLSGIPHIVIKVGGTLDETGAPYVTEVWTGKP